MPPVPACSSVGAMLCGLLVAGAACTTLPVAQQRPPEGSAELLGANATSDRLDSEAGDGEAQAHGPSDPSGGPHVPTSSGSGTAPRCSPDMALVPAESGEFCIDRVEASIQRRTPSGQMRPWPGNLTVDGIEQDIVAVSRVGAKPQGYISAVQAGQACERAGKRLCRSQEWLTACRGPQGTRYPYGNERRAGACNDRFEGLEHHPVVHLFRRAAPPGTDEKQMWTAPWLNDSRLHELPHTVAPTAAFPECVNGYGVADMVGNLHEWVGDEGGVFRGGFFMDTYRHGEGCEYETTIHGAKYHDYSTGFRCCADADGDGE